MKHFLAVAAVYLLLSVTTTHAQCTTLKFDDLKKISHSRFPEDLLLEKGAIKLSEKTWGLCIKVICESADSVSKRYNERLFFPSEEDSVSISMIYYTYSQASYTDIKNKAKDQFRFIGKETIGDVTLDFFFDGKYYYSFAVSPTRCNMANVDLNFYEVRFYREKPAYLE